MNQCFRHVIFYFCRVTKQFFEVWKKKHVLNAWQHNVCTFDSDAFTKTLHIYFLKLETALMDALIHCLSANLGLVQNKSMLECQASLSMYGEKNSTNVYWRTMQELRHFQVRVTPWNAPMWRTMQKLWRYFRAFEPCLHIESPCFWCDV